MAVSIEPNSQLITSEYWNGVDIANPDCFTIRPPEEFSAGKFQRFRASLAFKDGLVSIADTHAEADETVFTRWFDPPKEHLPDGTLVVVEREALVAGIEDDNTLQVVHETATAMKSHPISQPFSVNWLNAQYSQVEDCGVEQAMFADQNALYLRSLLWGVLISKQNGTRGMLTWQFNDPVLERDEEGEHIAITAPDEEAEAIPMEVGVAGRGRIIQEGSLSIRAVERNKSITVVRRADTNGLRGDKHRSLASLRERISSILTEPVQIGPVGAN